MRRTRIAKTSIVLAESVVLILAALAEQAHHCERSRGIIMNNTLAELVSQRRVGFALKESILAVALKRVCFTPESRHAVERLK